MNGWLAICFVKLFAKVCLLISKTMINSANFCKLHQSLRYTVLIADTENFVIKDILISLLVHLYSLYFVIIVRMSSVYSGVSII